MKTSSTAPHKQYRNAIGSSNSTPRYTPKELKAGTQTHLWAAMFIAALFEIEKRQKQFKCTVTYEWHLKMWFIHIVQYYPVIKRNEILIHATT